MTFLLFGPLTMLGEKRPAVPAGPFQPMFDPSGQPIPEPGDGIEPRSHALLALAAGVLQSSDDPGRITFDGAPLDCSFISTDSRLLLSAGNASAGRWAGQIRYCWISDLLVRPGSGRRDAGHVRILFLDPLASSGFQGRQYLDLTPTRKMPSAVLGRDLLQRIAGDRHRWVPADAPGIHESIDRVLRQSPRPSRDPAWYPFPMPIVPLEPAPAPETSDWVDPAAVTVRIAAGPGPKPPEPLPDGIPSPSFAGIPPQSFAGIPPISPWSPPPESPTQVDPTPTPEPPPAESTPAAAPRIETAGPPSLQSAGSRAAVAVGAMIVAVPGVGRHAAAPAARAPVPRAPAPSEETRDGHRSYRVEVDTGDVVVIDESTLFGRRPAAEDDEEVLLHTVHDASLSFSKTHLLLTVSPAGISVTDRHSTNGVFVRGIGQPAACAPGVPQLLQLPATLLIGSRTMLVAAADRDGIGAQNPGRR